jgi:hypothetical protein
MNIFSSIIIVLNAGLLAGALSGIFLDLPAKSDLANKERVQTTLLQTVSDRDIEMESAKQRTEKLETENPLLPTKIEEVKNNLKIREFDLSVKKKQFEKASSVFENLKKQNEEKEIEILQASSTQEI